MKLALLQVNPTVGDLKGNASALLEAAARAKAGGADLAIAPELSLVGYPPRDLLDRPAFVAAVEKETDALIARVPDIPLAFGTVSRSEGRLQNQAVLAQGGKVLARAAKQLLPNYDVFDERRHFRSGRELIFVELLGKRCALSICEDAWAHSDEAHLRYDNDPLEPLHRGADLLINLSASPFTLKKRTSREALFRDVARRFSVSVAMVNQVGANDELVFDGSSLLIAPNGDVLARAKAFATDFLIADLTSGGRCEATVSSDEEAAYAALVLGLRDYARKCGFRRAVLGLSGGIDSALVATLASDALGPDNVLGVAMPSRYSSQDSLEDARDLATHLGIDFRVIPIEPMFQAYIDGLSAPLDELGAASDEDVTWENVQARIRGAIVMAISNRTRALPLTTGNKSELAVGYCTLYGDMVGGLNLISDVPKTMVYRLARFINRDGTRIPVRTIEKPPSAELKPDQKDQDTLPPYDLLDAILEGLVERHQSASDLVAAGFDAQTVDRVTRLVARAEYKRRQAAPGLIITQKAFGSGRRLPIARAVYPGELPDG